VLLEQEIHPQLVLLKVILEEMELQDQEIMVQQVEAVLVD